MFKKIELERLRNKRVMIAPVNPLSTSLFSFLKGAGINVVGLVDKNKSGEGIYNYDNYKSNNPDIVLVASPNYWRQICSSIGDTPTLMVEAIFAKKFIYKNDWKGRLQALCFASFQLFRKHFNTLNRSFRKLQSLIGIPATVNSYRLLSLKSKYKGKRAFIIGTGPSLRIEDLEKLQSEITFACNKIYLAFEETSWRPTLYTIEDPLDIAEYIEDVEKHLNNTTMIFPESYMKNHRKIPNAIHYESLSSQCGYQREFTHDMFAGLYGGESVVYGMIQMLVYMGVKEIYLLGVDFTYFYKEQQNSPYLIGSGEINHFHKDYRKEGDLWVEPRLENSIGEYTKAREVSEEMGIKIVNSTRGGALEVFERKDFDSLFEDKRTWHV